MVQVEPGRLCPDQSPRSPEVSSLMHTSPGRHRGRYPKGCLPCWALSRSPKCKQKSYKGARAVPVQSTARMRAEAPGIRDGLRCEAPRGVSPPAGVQISRIYARYPTEVSLDASCLTAQIPFSPSNRQRIPETFCFFVPLSRLSLPYGLGMGPVD